MLDDPATAIASTFEIPMRSADIGLVAIGLVFLHSLIFA